MKSLVCAAQVQLPDFVPLATLLVCLLHGTSCHGAVYSSSSGQAAR